jgi:hypothetical protein
MRRVRLFHRATGFLAVLAAVIVVTLVAGAPAIARHKPKPHRPGCGSFCQQAGPPAGGGGPPLQLPVVFFGHVLHVRAGAVRVDVKCILKKPCIGALGVWDEALAYPGNGFGRLGAVDMSIAAGTRTVVTVPLGSKPLALIGALPGRSVPATIFARTKGHCFGPKDCATSGINNQSVRVTLS